MANYREDLIRLIENGTPKDAIIAYFISARHISRRQAISLLNSAGMMVAMFDPGDTITEERRREVNGPCSANTGAPMPARSGGSGIRTLQRTHRAGSPFALCGVRAAGRDGKPGRRRGARREPSRCVIKRRRYVRR